MDTIASVELLSKLIEIPSISRSEKDTGDLIASYLSSYDVCIHRIHYNIIARSPRYNSDLPTILLCSHHDTVPPSTDWTVDPYQATQKDNTLIGLGSNDAGAALVCLLASFINNVGHKNLGYNIVFAAVAEEEISGEKGIRSILSEIHFDMAIIGEPTGMNMAVAERGLLVIDGYATGVSGHVANNQGVNALYTAMEDIAAIRNVQWDLTSDYLQDTQSEVTVLAAGQKHNVIPDQAHFIIDARINDRYSNREVFDTLQSVTQSTLKARSMHLNSSTISNTHPLVRSGHALGLTSYGSPTLSDMALLDCPSIKIGPGQSKRSHQADEYIRTEEITQGLIIYQKLLDQLSIAIRNETLDTRKTSL